MQDKLDFSICILQFNFFNGFAASDRYDVFKNTYLPDFQHFQQSKAILLSG